MRVNRVFENENFIAVDKAAGQLTVPGRTLTDGEKDSRSCLKEILRAEIGDVYPVHRLDAEVSGLVLFAKNAQAHRTANLWFENRQVRKRYEAFTEGEPPRDWRLGASFRWMSRILRGKKRAYEHAEGKVAETTARWLGPHHLPGIGDVQRWELEPCTGRSHQLRFELVKHGFPIVGDALYGAKHGLNMPGIALRSILLDFRECPEATSLGLPHELTISGLEVVVCRG